MHGEGSQVFVRRFAAHTLEALQHRDARTHEQCMKHGEASALPQEELLSLCCGIPGVKTLGHVVASLSRY